MNAPEKTAWDRLCRPPQTALKTIKGGRLSGMTDVNPQWRYKVMHDVYGPCGIGWKYEVTRTWTEQGEGGQVFAFATVNVYVKNGEDWSGAIPGVGGSMLLETQKGSLHHNDEAFKMATTDALSVALKMLGVAADIYMGKWDGSKYKDGEDTTKPKALPDEEAAHEYDKWIQVKSICVDDDGHPDDEKISQEWAKLPSNVRAAIKRYGETLSKNPQ